jgi:hypothetical protein
MLGRLLGFLDKIELNFLVVVSRATDPEVGRYVRGLDLSTPTTSVECTTTGTLHSLRAGLRAVATDRVLLALVDAVFPEEELIRFQEKALSFETLHASGIQWVRQRLPDDSPNEQGVKVFPSGLIADIGPSLTSEPLISQGISLYNRALLEHADEAVSKGAAGLSDFLPFVVRKDGVALYAYRCDRIRDVDTELDRRTVEQLYCKTHP